MTVRQLATASRRLVLGSNLRLAAGRLQVQNLSIRWLPAIRCMLLRCWVSGNSASGLSQQWQTQWAETSLNRSLRHGGGTGLRITLRLVVFLVLRLNALAWYATRALVISMDQHAACMSSISHCSSSANP